MIGEHVGDGGRALVFEDSFLKIALEGLGGGVEIRPADG